MATTEAQVGTVQFLRYARIIQEGREQTGREMQDFNRERVEQGYSRARRHG